MTTPPEVSWLPGGYEPAVEIVFNVIAEWLPSVDAVEAWDVARDTVWRLWRAGFLRDL